MNYRKLAVFDFETDGKDGHTCQPVQIAALVLDGRKLKPMAGGSFNLMLKPEGIDKDEYFTDEVNETIAWHAKNYECSSDDIIQKWKGGCDQKHGWTQFSQFINKFNYSGKSFHAPIPCGINIKDFDLKIAARLNNKYKINTMFWLRDAIDIIPLCFMWFENIEEGPSNFRMDTLRDYFGMSKEGAHDAMTDVRDEAWVITKFLKLHRRYAHKVAFKGAYK